MLRSTGKRDRTDNKHDANDQRVLLVFAHNRTLCVCAHTCVMCDHHLFGYVCRVCTKLEHSQSPPSGRLIPATSDVRRCGLVFRCKFSGCCLSSRLTHFGRVLGRYRFRVSVYLPCLGCLCVVLFAILGSCYSFGTGETGGDEQRRG